MEKREPLYTVDGNVNWYSHDEKQFLKKKFFLTVFNILIVLIHYSCISLLDLILETNPFKYKIKVMGGLIPSKACEEESIPPLSLVFGGLLALLAIFGILWLI